MCVTLSEDRSTMLGVLFSPPSPRLSTAAWELYGHQGENGK